MAPAAQLAAQHEPHRNASQRESQRKKLRAQLETYLLVRGNVYVRGGEKNPDESPYQQVGKNRGQRLLRIRLPGAPAKEVFNHVSDIGELVEEDQNGNSGQHQRQPGNHDVFGIIGVQVDAVALKPEPKKITKTSRGSHQTSQHEHVA